MVFQEGKFECLFGHICLFVLVDYGVCEVFCVECSRKLDEMSPVLLLAWTSEMDESMDLMSMDGMHGETAGGR